MLFGAAFFAVPGIGPILVGGPLLTWIIGALGDAAVVGGLSALGVGLYSIGIPKNSVLRYETAIKGGKYLVIAHGTADEVAKAKEIIEGAEAVESTIHHGEKFAKSVGP